MNGTYSLCCSNSRKELEIHRKSIKDYVLRNKPATRHLRRLLAPRDKSILLEFDKQKYDEYGRMLAYVWFKEEMINLRMIEDGYAEPCMYEGLKYENEFRKHLAQDKGTP